MTCAHALLVSAVLLVGCGTDQGPGATDESPRPTASASGTPERANRYAVIAGLLPLAGSAPPCGRDAIAGPPDDPTILFLHALGLEPIVEPCGG